MMLRHHAMLMPCHAMPAIRVFFSTPMPRHVYVLR